MRVPIFSKLRSLLIFGPACGKNSYIDKSVQFIGSNNIQIGNNSVIGERSWFVVSNMSSDQIEIKIEANSFVGRDNYFLSGGKIILREYFLSAPHCSFISGARNKSNPLIPSILATPEHDREIYIGVNCFIGINSTLIGNINIGHGSVIGANSLVNENVLPFSMVVGNKAKVIKRYSFIKMQWINIDEFTLQDQSSLPNEDEYLRAIEINGINIEMPLIASARKFGNI